MKNSAPEIVQWCRDTMNYLAGTPAYKTRMAVKHEVADRSGVSFSLVEKFHQGHCINMTVNKLDAIHTALKEMTIEQAA